MTTSNAPPPLSPPGLAEVRAWLDYATETLALRRDELVNALLAVHEAHPQVTDEATAELVTDDVNMAVKWLAKVEQTRKAEKEPYIRGGQEVDAFIRKLCAPLSPALDPVRASLTAYHNRRAEAARLAREAAAREAEEVARAAAQKAADALATAAGAAALDAAQEAAVAAEKATQAALARPSAMVQTRGMYGGVASLRQTWDFEFDSPPGTAAAACWWVEHSSEEEVKVAIGAKVRAAMDRDPKTGEPRGKIPGIRWVKKQTLQVR